MLDTGRRFEAVGSRNPAFITWRSPAALALVQLGKHDEARRLVREELELARTWAAPRALGAALRAAGLVEGGECGLLDRCVGVLLEEALQPAGRDPRMPARILLRDQQGQLERVFRRLICGSPLAAASAAGRLPCWMARWKIE
jgi:hypothetical protein